MIGGRTMSARRGSRAPKLFERRPQEVSEPGHPLQPLLPRLQDIARRRSLKAELVVLERALLDSIEPRSPQRWCETSTALKLVPTRRPRLLVEPFQLPGPPGRKRRVPKQVVHLDQRDPSVRCEPLAPSL